MVREGIQIVANRILLSPVPANCTHHEGPEPLVDNIGMMLYFSRSADRSSPRWDDPPRHEANDRTARMRIEKPLQNDEHYL